MEEKQDYGVEEEMTLDDVDSVRGLLDRLKYEKEKELKHVSSAGTSSLQDNEISTSHSSKNDLVGELQKKQKSRVTKTKSSPGNIRSQTETADTSKKRKQNEFSVEVQERAEVISKSARKGPGTLVSSLAENTEGDSDTEEFLKTIRAAPSAPTQGQSEFVHTRVHRSKSASEVDLSVVVSNSSQLNLEAQKSKITVARSGSMKGRRKPTVSMRRRSLKSGFMDDWDDEEDISEGDESMDEDTGMGLSGESFIFKEPPKMPAGNDGIKQRSKPKHKKKSHTVSGIVLPGLAETLKTRNSSTRDVAQPQVSAAEVVRVAAEGKRNQAAKEERVEKEAEKPAWLVEAEARRKLHEQRRHNKTKQHEEREQDQSKPHNVVLRPVRKAEHGRTKTNEDNDVSREALNIRLRPVPKQESITLQAQEGNENDNKKSHNVVLRPIPKRESAVIDREDSNEKFYNVRLRPVGSSGISGTTSSSSQHSSRSLTPISLDNPTRRRSESKVSEVSSSHSTRLNGGGSRVTVSSDYVNAPHKLTTKSKTSLNNKSKTVTVTASEVPDPSATARRKSVEFVHTKVEWKGSSSAAALGHAVSRNSHSDLKEASHDRAVTYDPTYRPSHTGEVLPQWKIDLMEKKKYVAAFPVRPPPATQISNTATVPQWKKQLAEKRKQRVDLNDVQETNKENESKTSPETPLWKKEVAERRKRREASPVRKHPEIIEKRPEIPEWKKKLSVSRRPKSTTIAENPAEESVDQVPGFMKEFEKKKKNRTRGMLHAGIGPSHVNSLLTSINLPAVAENTLKAREREIGPVIEKVAKESCETALQVEKTKWISAEGSDGSETVGIGASYDAGWQKRGKGHNSLTAGTMIGIKSGQVIGYSTRNKRCAICEAASRTGQAKVRCHDCRLNWSGSSKAMEPDMGAEIAQKCANKYNAEVQILIGDDDSATVKKVRESVTHNVEKWSDINHAKKSFTSHLYTLQSEFKGQLSTKVVEYFAKCFGYALVQNRNDAQGLKQSLRAIIPHAFGKHKYCSVTWCGFLKDPSSYCHASLAHGNDLKGDKMEEELTNVIDMYIKNAEKLAPLGSSQGNEALNNTIGSKAPKIRHYGASESNDFRVACAVSQKNLGHNYVSELIMQRFASLQRYMVLNSLMCTSFHCMESRQQQQL